MLSLLIGALAAGATFGYAKLKKTSDGKSAAAAAGIGILAYWMWPLALVGGAALAGYQWMAKRGSRQVGGSDRKMIGPGR